MQPTTPFTLSISRYKQVQEAKKPIVYYMVEIDKKDAGDWKLEKRFKEFDELNTTLRRTFSNLPQFPAKSLFPLKGELEIEKRRQGLEKYMKAVASRPDVMNSDIINRFLELDTFAPETTAAPPKLMLNLDSLILGVRDFFYQEDEGILFTGLSDMNVASRVDSYLTNIKLPWHKDDIKKKGAIVGAVECYMQIGAHDNLKFQKLWIKSFHTQVINVYWDQASCLLLTGKDDGTITVLKVASELNYSKFDEVVTSKLHHGRIMGIYIDSISEFVYSIGEDKKFIAYDLLKNELIADIACGEYLLTSLVPDKENKRIFISNRSGQVFVYDIGSVTPKYIHTVQAFSKGTIRGICFDSYRNFLLAANYDDGTIDIIDVQKPDRVKHSQISTQFKGNKRVRSIIWSTNRGEIFTGAEDGTVAFWDAKKTTPIYSMKAHSLGVTKIQFLNNRNILITGGKDSKLRFYNIPVDWTDKGLDDGLFKNRESGIQKATKSLTESRARPIRVLDDSDDENDERSGWAKE